MQSKAISPFVGVVLLIAFTIGIGGIITVFFTNIVTVQTQITQNKSESFVQCAVALLRINENLECTTKNTDSNLVLLMHLNDGSGTNARDFSVFGNNGTLGKDTGACTGIASGCPDWTTGKYGSGVKFEGLTSRISIPENDSLDIITGVAGLTIEVWVNLDTAPSSTEYIVDKGSTSIFSTEHEYTLALTSGGRQIRFALSNETTNDFTTGDSLSAGQWYHIAATYDGSTMKIYTNGIQNVSYSTKLGLPLKTDSNNLTIGKPLASSFSPLNGTIDEVRIYNKSLSSSEIQNHFQNGVNVRIPIVNIGQVNLGKRFYVTSTIGGGVNSTTANISVDLTPGQQSTLISGNLTADGSLTKVVISNVLCPNVLVEKKDVSNIIC